MGEAAKLIAVVVGILVLYATYSIAKEYGRDPMAVLATILVYGVTVLGALYIMAKAGVLEGVSILCISTWAALCKLLNSPANREFVFFDPSPAFYLSSLFQWGVGVGLVMVFGALLWKKHQY